MPIVSDYRRFKAVVIQAAPSQCWQAVVSRWLVSGGCLYMIAWGEGCSSWDDSVDHANLEDWDYGDIPDKHLVMTIWHEHEPLCDALGFARVAAWHSDVDLQHCLLIDVGAAERPELLRNYELAWRD